MDEDSILALLGLSLPKVYAVNRFTEWAQEEIKALGWWDSVSSFSMLIPFVVALVLSSFGESGCQEVMQSGAIYGAAAIILHEIHGGGS